MGSSTKRGKKPKARRRPSPPKSREREHNADQVRTISLPEAVNLLEQLVEELGGREALSLEVAQRRSTGEAMAELFDENPDDEIVQGPFLSEGSEGDKGVAYSTPSLLHADLGSSDDALLAGASVDDSVDFWAELDKAQVGVEASSSPPRSSAGTNEKPQAQASKKDPDDADR